MGNPAGERRDFVALEQRRRDAIRLLQQGLSQSEVARQVAVSHRSVGRWAPAYAEQGRDGLRKAGRAGREVAPPSRRPQEPAGRWRYSTAMVTVLLVTPLAEMVSETAGPGASRV